MTYEPINLPTPKGFTERQWSNFQKMFNNHMNYYEKNPPFESNTGNNWRLFFSLFHYFKVVRWMIGGTWIRGEFGLWMKTTKHFPKEWLEKHQHEVWRQK